jgi:hypothetical protein
MIVPSWVYWLAIAGVASLVVGQEARVQSLKADIANIGAERDKEARARAEDLANYRSEKADLARQHATQQQETVDAYQEKLRLAQGNIARRDQLIGGLRKQLAAYATVDRTPGESDTAVIQRATDRLQTLAGLLAEGAGLVAEGTTIVERRDAEVALLAGQVKVDRGVCSR